MTVSHKNRFLLFADILGTSALYLSTPPKTSLLERRRIQLGRAIHTATFEYFNSAYACKPHVSVFSDTVLIANDNADILLMAGAKLFHLFSLHSLDANSVDEMFLLRGGIAYGERLDSNFLHTSNDIDVSNIYDTSLALAYKLEQLRKGSRLFLCRNTYEVALRESKLPCFQWRSITGIGVPMSPAFELLWPALLFGIADQFERYLGNLFETWKRLFGSQETWAPEQYNLSLYQLDETIKLCIRSAWHAPEEQIRSVWRCLLLILPSETPDLENLDIQYSWGLWFQVLWALIKLHDRGAGVVPRHNLRSLVLKNIEIIKRLKYWSFFLTELEQPDYIGFRSRLVDLRIL